MNRDEYFEFQQSFFDRAIKLTRKKNHDYAGENGDDPFRNFRKCERDGVCSVEQGFLVRLSDKFSRLATFCAAGQLLVANESVEDTLIDISNYSCLLSGYLRSKGEDGKREEPETVPEEPELKVGSRVRLSDIGKRSFSFSGSDPGGRIGVVKKIGAPGGLNISVVWDDGRRNWCIPVELEVVKEEDEGDEVYS